MRRFINQFKNLDNTKKIVIAFVSISFALIFSITIFNMVSENNVEQKTNISHKQTKKKTDDKKETSEANKEQVAEEEVKEEVSDQNVTGDVATQANDDAQQNVQSSSNTGNNSTIQYMNISISIVGMNGTQIASGSINIEKGKSAYDSLLAFAKQNGISISTTGFGPYVYVSGINDLYEHGHGANSGWMYKVEKDSPNVGAGNYFLNDGDQMEWYYVYD